MADEGHRASDGAALGYRLHWTVADQKYLTTVSGGFGADATAVNYAKGPN
ncbi:hypothetical protein QRB32_09270 [Mycobacterium intracellulare subsp. chimaera]|nr:hypothetical protein [Mycobacterium intracellulare]MDM3932392.1 hypothetical protein [Mycobacterium intracellulare subsp. chimaera]